MIDAHLVEGAAIFPGCCVFCGGQRAPILDTRVERPGLGRLYVCKGCAKRAAVLYGFAEGERLDQLENATGELEQAEREIARRNERITLLEVEFKEEKAARLAAEADRDAARGEVQRLEHIAHDVVGAAKDLAAKASN